MRPRRIRYPQFRRGRDGQVRGVTAASGGKKFVGLDFINYDYAFAGAWGWDTNTRNVTIGVNGGKQKRWALPLAGNDWFEAGRVMVELDGFEAGSGNSVVFGTVPGKHGARI
ncbi:unnamed protein product [Parascedosporium putredinis]|uniref:Uncharacterized protein n=1 Tax=Parascedosporium putredinis TaxID=1442378 RepID=A0A9P1M886_9PEZI|nr:unnamed protein product [Parascedosporium putredinis]CAI7989644.1 unnamed protein product [Parascedosporium putredinis]